LNFTRVLIPEGNIFTEVVEKVIITVKCAKPIALELRWVNEAQKLIISMVYS
jgi:hypothetical protein